MSKTTLAKKAKKMEANVESPVGKKAIAPETNTTEATVVAEVVKTVNKKEFKPGRSAAYKKAKSSVDPKKFYSPKDAIELAKKTSYSKFIGKLEAHIVTLHNPGNIGEIVFPHLKTAAKKIAIADESVIKNLKEGKIDFDILVATPATMPKLLPFARLLGPKGLMPNPKNGTVSDKPEDAVKKLSVAKLVIKTEKTAPVVHMQIGKLDQKDAELLANLDELVKVLGGPQKIKKLVLSPTMGPGIKVQL